MDVLEITSFVNHGRGNYILPLALAKNRDDCNYYYYYYYYYNDLCSASLGEEQIRFGFRTEREMNTINCICTSPSSWKDHLP